MTENIKLNMGERFLILSLLPAEGDYTTIKILRKLRETLAPDEKENEEYKFQHEYQCPHKDYDERGRRMQCEYTEVTNDSPKCQIHQINCIPNGRIFWPDEIALKEKEIWLGNKAKELIISALKQLEEKKQLKDEDGTAKLYEKFFKEADDEI